MKKADALYLARLRTIRSHLDAMEAIIGGRWFSEKPRNDPEYARRLLAEALFRHYRTYGNPDDGIADKQPVSV